MLSFHDQSLGFGGIRHNISPHNNRHHDGKSIRQHELDELETSKTRQCLKKTTKFLFSHVGLVGLVAIYAVAGGFLFQLLEIREEKLNCQENEGEYIAQVTQLKQNIVNYIQNNATPTNLNTLNQQDNSTIAFEKVGAMLYAFRTFVLETSSKYRSLYGDNCSITTKWTYPNSLLFAITIITTIGYGNITPMTSEGQLCCICYATIGIPIFLLCLANISGVLGEMFRLLYAKILCGPCLLFKKHRAKIHKDKFEEESGINFDQTRSHGWKLDNDDNQKNLQQQQSSNSTASNENIDDEEIGKDQRVAVPLTVTMIIIAAYIWIGSVLFHNFEGWTMMQSGYFCFITLATIGFGDFVPGQQPNEKHAGEKLILGAIYVLFGMATLAMCFDLMQEEIVSKFRWIGTKVGIVEKHEETNDSNDQLSNSKTKNPSTINEIDGSMITNRTIIENDTDSLKQRKTSPRNNIARIHPTNEETLHQRISPTKVY